jgi:hypothetical protein
MEDDPPPPFSTSSIKEGYNDRGRNGLFSQIAVVKKEDNREREEDLPPSMCCFVHSKLGILRQVRLYFC